MFFKISSKNNFEEVIVELRIVYFSILSIYLSVNTLAAARMNAHLCFKGLARSFRENSMD